MASEGAAAASETAPEPGDAPAFDTSVAHVARVYNYWLGGKDNFAADRAAARAGHVRVPGHRAVGAGQPGLPRAGRSRYLAREAGIRQFLDIGTGIPSANNTHEVAQSVAADSRIVYVDNDPVVLAHARALLTSSPSGATDYIDADLRHGRSDPGRGRADAGLHSAGRGHADGDTCSTSSDEDDPYAVVGQLMAAVPSGSYLVLSHPAKDIHAAEMAAMAERLNQMMAEKVTFRSEAEVARFFTGLELVEPGMTNVPNWRPDTEEEASSPAALWAGVARKP